MSTSRKPKLKVIRASLAYTRLPDEGILTRGNMVLKGTFGNPAYTNTPVDQPTFKAGIDAYTAAIAAAVGGGKKATDDRRKKREDLLLMMRLLGHYVEANSKNDMTTFRSSGFEPASTAKAPAQPPAQPAMVRVDQGHSGQLLPVIKASPKARTHELRYAVLTGTTPGPWTDIVLPGAKAEPINGLTPGTTYTFQVRAFGKLGYSDWSDPVSRMCI